MRAAFAFLAAGPALACDPGEGVFVSCLVAGSGERLEVRNDARSVRYGFGPVG